MTNKVPIGPSLTLARMHRPDRGKASARMAGIAAAMLMSLSLVGAVSPAFGQANQVGTCNLSSTTVNSLRSDVASGIGSAAGDVEVAFVVVYSINNDNNGQPVATGTTGPILCTNATVVNRETTDQTTQIPSSGTVDIFDSSEAFILRYQHSGASEAESRFCHTVNANVDCFHLSPPGD